jgi:hypothetical protein
VCKVAFLRIHGVTNGRLNRALQASAEGSPHLDQRGRHTPANKTADDDIAFVKEHIQSFPMYKSHYSRADNPNKYFLSSDLSIAKMFELYGTHCTKEEKHPVSEWVYRKVFNENFNLSFGRPKSDTCKSCDTYKVKTESEKDETKLIQLRGQWELHLRKAEQTYHQLREDTALCQSEPNCLVLTFDLQQSLPTPVLTTNIVYYKRQLWTYNFGIHECRTGRGHMYVWHEGMASRGSHEMGSCILKHCQATNPASSHLITYSDSCGGQNRNVNLLALWLYMVESSDYPFTIIDQKFMIVGHSYLPNDRDFGSIETARRKASHVYVPQDWMDLIKSCRRQNAFAVTEMAADDFVSLEPLSKAFINRKVNTDKEKVNWLSIRWIRVQKSKPMQFQYRHTHNSLEAWKTVDLKRKTKGRSVNLAQIPLPVLYPNMRQLKANKVKDLTDLLQFIPPVHHGFYRQLLEDHTDSDDSQPEDDEYDSDESCIQDPCISDDESQVCDLEGALGSGTNSNAEEEDFA